MINTINKSIAKRREELAENEKGFTLIELLVVVLIIGILAAIAIPAFLNQRQGAWEAQVKSDIGNAVIAAETYSTNKNGSYVGFDAAALTANGYKSTAGVTIVPSGATATEYILTVKHSSMSTTTWVYTHSTDATVKTP